MTIFYKFNKWLSEPVNGYVIGMFRLMYGLFMMYEVGKYISNEMVKHFFVEAQVNFPYDGLAWLQPLPVPALNAVLNILFVCALLIALGVMMK